MMNKRKSLTGRALRVVPLLVRSLAARSLMLIGGTESQATLDSPALKEREVIRVFTLLCSNNLAEVW